MSKKDNLIYNLSKNMVIFLFIYYFMILILGGIVSIEVARTLTEKVISIQILEKSFIASISVSGMLCSIQYIKRLYKACITERINIVENDIMKRIGNMSYFIFRPIFAFVFSIIMVFAMLSGMFVVTGNLDYMLNEKFVYLCVILSSFLGYSIGKLIDKFDNISEEKINSLR